MSSVTAKCNRWFFPQHTWGRWETIDRGEIVETTYLFFNGTEKKTAVVGRYIHQKRQCIDCHLIEIKKETSRIDRG